jgi:hypothetical protein
VGNCCMATSSDSGGKYLLGAMSFGENAGVYEVAIAQKKCISLFPGVETFAVNFAPDGKSFPYVTTSEDKSRQAWSTGAPVVRPTSIS